MGHRQPLTAREREVARLAVEGMTRKEIAGRLCISENSVKTHLEHIYDKLGARNRLEMEHKLRQPTNELLSMILALPLTPNLPAAVAEWISVC